MTKTEIEDKFFDYQDEYMELFEEGNIQQALEKIREFWLFLPQPRIMQDMSFLLLEDFFNICIQSKKFDLANKWISLIFISDLERLDDGEREFIAGNLAYEQGNLEIAKELFIISNVKCEGCLFEGKDVKKYRDLLK